MSLKSGIVGLPNVGKSTLFNAVVENGKAQAANFPFCTIEPNVEIVAVPDPRLNVLSDLSKSRCVVPASLELVDIAGLVKGASQGEDNTNSLKTQLDQQKGVVDNLVSNTKLLENKIQEARSKKDTLKARAQSAKTANKVSEMVGNVNTSALSAFEKLEEKVLALESQAEALGQLTTNDLEGKATAINLVG